MLDTIEELSNEVIGREVVSIDVYEDGLHLSLSDGKVLILVGAVGIGLLESPVTIQ
jgi:hypothetical protein